MTEASKIAAKYDGLADFFRRATPEEMKIVMEDAAHKANEDQLKVYNKWKDAIKNEPPANTV